MKTLLSLLLSALLVSAYAQKDNRIVIGTVDTIYSKILNEKRTILVHAPDGDKTQHYPVYCIFSTAKIIFNLPLLIVEQISGSFPDMVIVGITNTDR